MALSAHRVGSKRGSLGSQRAFPTDSIVEHATGLLDRLPCPFERIRETTEKAEASNDPKEIAQSFKSVVSRKEAKSGTKD